MSYNKNIYYDEDRAKIEKANAMETLNNLAQSHSIKDQLLKNQPVVASLENFTSTKEIQDSIEVNNKKLYNFL